MSNTITADSAMITVIDIRNVASRITRHKLELVREGPNFNEVCKRLRAADSALEDVEQIIGEAIE